MPRTNRPTHHGPNLILAHQVVKKVNANDYKTSIIGQKFKVAHKHANNAEWNANDRVRHNGDADGQVTRSSDSLAH